jgi:glycosyltransferase involved in cell wall biosynthesis
MRVLLLTYYFPPDPEVGGVRPARLARFLASAGHEVHVLTVAGPDVTPGSTTLEPGLTVHRVRPWRNLRTMLGRLYLAAGMQKGAESLPDSTERAESPSAAQRMTRWLRRFVLSAAWLPDDRHGFIGPAAIRGRALVARVPIDVIYMTGPPWSVHVAGMLLGTITRCPVVAEYRDPWIPTLMVEELNHPMAVSAKRWLQRRSLERAAAVVTVTESIGTHVRHLARRSLPFVTALNGVENMALPRRGRTTGPIRIVHAGELYSGRDPRPFLRAVAEVIAARPLSPSAVRIQFLGNGRFFGGVSVEGLAQQLGLEEFVEFQDQVGFEESRQIMAEADALLLLAQQQPMQVPNKLFDYLAAARPIIAFVDAGGESERILRGLEGHRIVTDWNSSQAAEAVAAIIDSAREQVLDANAPSLQQLSSDFQFGRVVSSVESMIHARS